MTTATFPRRRAPFLLGAIAVLSLAGCGAAGPTTATSTVGDVVVISTTVTAAPTVSRDDLRDEQRATPASADVGDDPRVLHVTYSGGAAPCRGARLAVDEGAAVVRIVLFEGTPPEAARRLCPAGAVRREVVVRLDKALGSREVLWS